VTIGIVCPIGPTDRWGYQRNLDVCVGSFCDFADAVILVQSHPGNPALCLSRDNTVILSDSRTWFSDGQYKAERVAANRNLGADELRRHGCATVLHLDCNWYIPESSRDGLLKTCCEAKSLSWLYRGIQFGNILFSAGMRLPNVHGAGTHMAEDDDSAYLPNGAMVKRERGYWPDHDTEMAVDVDLEVTWDELEERLNFVKCYADLAPDRSSIFGRKFWQSYSVKKARGRKPSGINLGAIGKTIAARHRQDFVSQSVADELKWKVM
jgi:hypothetical protein